MTLRVQSEKNLRNGAKAVYSTASGYTPRMQAGFGALGALGVVGVVGFRVGAFWASDLSFSGLGFGGCRV